MTSTPEQRKVYNRKWYLAHREDQIARAVVNNVKVRKVVVAAVTKIKRGPCKDCRRRFHPHVMDFDHVRGKKKDHVSHLARSHSLKTVLAEIAKCDLVCSNCHRMRTLRRSKRS